MRNKLKVIIPSYALIVLCIWLGTARSEEVIKRGGSTQWIDSSNGIYTTGNVGIGTTSPSGQFQIGSGDGVVFVGSNGNLGIGTTTPGALLDIRRASASSNGVTLRDNGVLQLRLGTDGTSGGFFELYEGGSVVSYFSGVTNEHSYFNTTGANVGIGTNNPTSKLHVIGTATFSTTVTGGGFVTTGAATQTIAGGDTILNNQCGGVKRIDAGGAVTTNTTNTFTPLSSERQCVMEVCNVDTVDTITLDQNALFKTVGGANLALAPNTCVSVGFDGGVWRQLSAVLTGT